MTAETVRWGILGGGHIGREFLRAAAASTTGVVTALGTRRPERVDLADHYPGLRVLGSYEALLADRELDAIYIATPHPFHAQWAIAAARFGKHVLCEKPAAMTASEVASMFAAASASGTFLGEAYMYRLHPLTARILGLLRAGKVGEIRMIKSSFGFALPVFLPEHRLFKKELGGGAILDVGGYPMSMARLIAGLDAPDGIAEPVDVAAMSRNGPTGVEELSTAMVSFANGIIAQLSCSIGLHQDNVLHVMGTEGRLEVDSFWFGSGRHGGTARMRFVPCRGDTEIIEVTEASNVYSFQFEAANRAIRAGRTRFAWPGMTEADSLGNARALDRWIAAATICNPPFGTPPGAVT
jgi:predicted dehydrogenase